jgi:adenylosuccinate synthase
MLTQGLGPDIFVVGCTWSDEGKGAVAANMAPEVSASVRWHGGASAGHNIILGDRSHHLHNFPCGITQDNHLNIVGPMCVIDPEIVAAEAAIPAQYGQTDTDIMVDSGTRIVLPIHKVLDTAREAVCQDNPYGTTRTGMGPAHEDLMGRKGLVVQDIVMGESRIRQKLMERHYYGEKLALARYWKAPDAKVMSLDETVQWCMKYQDLFRNLAGDTRREITRLRQRG